MATAAMAEGKSQQVVYYLEDEKTPYKVHVVPSGRRNNADSNGQDIEGEVPNCVTLGDLKATLKRSNYKYFFKTEDKDFGVVKEEIFGDDTPLPMFKNSVICWLELAGGSGSVVSARSSQDKPVRKHSVKESCDVRDSADSEVMTLPPPGLERGPGVGETRPPSFHGGAVDSPDDHDLGHTDDTESLLSNTRHRTHHGARPGHRQGGRSRPFFHDFEEGAGDLFDDAESNITSVSEAAERRKRELRARRNGRNSGRRGRGPGLSDGRHHPSRHDDPDLGSSELESSFYDSEEVGSMASSRMTTSTEHTSVGGQHLVHRPKRRSKRRVPQHLINRAGSVSSITDSAMSMNCITVTLNLDTVNFLGISIVGHSNTVGNEDWGIYVGSIMSGGAVALDGNIEPGDMLLEVNDISFEDMSNDDAVKVLREVVKKPGPIKLVVAKRWPQDTTTSTDTSSKNFLSMPRAEPVRPIDPAAWVAHTAAARGDFGVVGPPAPPLSHFRPQIAQGDYLGRHPSVTTLSGSSIVSSQAETEKYFPAGAPGLGGGNPGPPGYPPPSTQPAFDPSTVALTTTTDMVSVVRCMRAPNSGLEVKERVWLKIKIPNAFIGSEVVDWLFRRLQGFSNRRDARKYATQLLKEGYIKHSVQKTTFSEECYYTFADKDLQQEMAGLTLQDTTAAAAAAAAAKPPPIPSLGPPMQAQQPWGHPIPHGAPLAPLPAWTPGTEQWMPPESSTTTTTNYGPLGDISIYNPAAPPASANYAPGGPSYGLQHPHSSGGSGSGHSAHLLQLAGSGSGSESDGRITVEGSVVGSASESGGFRQRQQQHQMQHQMQQQELMNFKQASQASMGPPAYQAC